MWGNGDTQYCPQVTRFAPTFKYLDCSSYPHSEVELAIRIWEILLPGRNLRALRCIAQRFPTKLKNFRTVGATEFQFKLPNFDLVNIGNEMATSQLERAPGIPYTP